MTGFKGVLALALAGASVAAFAAPVDCSRAAAGDVQCAEQSFEQTQRRLDELLRELKGSLSQKNWAHLKQSQAFWEKSRSLECHIETSFVAGGPDQDAVKYACLEDHTLDRMHQLRYYLCPRYARTGQCDAERYYE